MATEHGFSEMIKWEAAGDSSEVERAAKRFGGTFVEKGEMLKVLDVGFLKRRVRLVKSDYECWVIAEMTERR
jgi:hypothetical protein